MDNEQLAQVFERIAALLQIKGEQGYRVRAYQRAAESIRSAGQPVEDLWRAGKLQQIPGVGEAIAAKIDELLRTGQLEYYRRLTEEVPESLLDLLQVSDVGPKKAARFWRELGVTSLEDLERAARAGKLRELPGMGAKSEQKILQGIEALRRRRTGRISIGQALPRAEELLQQLRELPGVLRAEPAGSLRRWRETIGDLDLLVASEEPQQVMEAFRRLPLVAQVRASGETKTSVVLRDGLQVQLWVHPPQAFGSAWQYATGSQAHNIRLRELALSKGLSLSEHGLRDEQGVTTPCATEQEVYQYLGLPWIVPELREDRGEIRAALEGRLPKLVELADLRGELHAHSDWSDGRATLEEMVQAALEAGFEYLAITDHSRSLGVANGLSLERLRAQREEIRRLQAQVGERLLLLHGAEVEVLADGSLDYPDEVLAELDIVFASVHSSLRQPRERITERYLRAVNNPHVDVIGHLSGRLIGKRDPADLDVERVLQAAAQAGVALEINCDPLRLDLKDIHARRAMELGCLMAICTDAHHPEQFAIRRFGVGTARRGWVEAKRVINCWPRARLLAWLKGRGGRNSS